MNRPPDAQAAVELLAPYARATEAAEAFVDAVMAIGSGPLNADEDLTRRTDMLLAVMAVARHYVLAPMTDEQRDALNVLARYLQEDE